jgi:predicted Rossmann fold nucleotide-binding protein DprA/Smf involved in DNA uptake
VPGPIGEPRAAGCLQWLRAFPGEARIVATVPELIADLGLLEEDAPAEPAADRSARGRADGRASRRPRPPAPSLAAVLIELGATAREVGAALVDGHGSLDELVAHTDLEPATVLGAITLLELRGLATSTYGRYRAAGQLAAASAPSRPPGQIGRLPARRGPC